MKSVREDLRDILNMVKAHVESERDSGVEGYYFNLNIKGENPQAQTKSQKSTALAELRNKVYKCKECLLWKTRRHVVFGEGNSDAKLIFVGEAPGAEEDLQGRPFVGMAGQLLTKVIEAIGLKREDVYICNVLRCRPPDNRYPLPTEIANCMHHLLSQLEIIKPKVICCLGKCAVQALLGSNESITTLRGKFHTFRGIKLMPTFHPAYLLRNPQMKRLVWQDMKRVRDELKK